MILRERADVYALLAAKRAELGITLGRFARYLATDQRAVTDFEQGRKMNLTTFFRVIDALGYDIHLIPRDRK